MSRDGGMMVDDDKKLTSAKNKRKLARVVNKWSHQSQGPVGHGRRRNMIL